MSSPGKASWCILRAHVAGVDAEHAEVGALGAEDGGEVLEAGLGGAVGTPALVGLDRGVGGDGDDGGAGPEVGEQRLDQPELGHQVDLEGGAEVAEPQAAERRQGRGAEGSGVQHHEVEPAERGGRGGEVVAVWLVGDVAGDGDGARHRRGRVAQRGWVAPVDDEGPTVVGQGAGEGEAEAP